MNQPIFVIRQKMTLTAEEQKNVTLGTVHEKKTETYKNAKKRFEDRIKVYSQIGTLSTTETKLWFDASNNSVKMQFVFDAVDKKKYLKFSKDVDKVFGEMNKDFDKIFKEMNEQMDATFKNLEPVMDNAFKQFDGLFDGLFDGFLGSDKKTKK